MMNSSSESGSLKGGLYCDLCNYIQFSSYTDWQVHHITHLRQPVVPLVKLNKNLCAKLLEGQSYIVNTGVARSSQHHVPPLKISLIKQGARTFTVKQESGPGSPKAEYRLDFNSKGSGDEFKPNFLNEKEKVEGKDLLERLGAGFSISRRGALAAAKKPELGDGIPNSDGRKGNILERLTGIGGISISTVTKPSAVESKPAPGISSKAKSIELSQLKTLKDQVAENERKTLDKSKILEKLSGSGLISIASKAGVKEDDKECRGEREEGSPKPEFLERLGPPSLKSLRSDDSNDSSDSKASVDGRTGQVNAGEENGKTIGESTGIEQKKFVRVKRSSFKKSKRPDRENSQEETTDDRSMAAGEEGKEKGRETGIDILERLTDSLNNTVGAEKSGMPSERKTHRSHQAAGKPPAKTPAERKREQRKRQRMRQAEQNHHHRKPRAKTPAERKREQRERERLLKERELVATEPSGDRKRRQRAARRRRAFGTTRARDGGQTNEKWPHCNFVFWKDEPLEPSNQTDCESVALGDPLAIDSDVGELDREINAPESEASESQFQIGGEKNSQDQVQGLLLTNSTSRGQDGENPDFGTISQNQQEPYGEPDNNVSEGNNEANENAVSFTSLSNDEQSEDQGEQQTAFWSDIQNSSNNVDQPQEDPLLTPENPVPNGESNFLHNFSSEYQTSGSHENSEFMSLDRLGQTQHQQTPYGSDQSSPMEHLSQQVQRIPNPAPQINVISQHHLQGPPPPQLHSGVPLSSTQANSYDSLHMQPPLPPPLYQGYMYNQSYSHQQQMPRAQQPQMPMLQQRPHIPSRSFQPMPVPQQRPRPRLAVKRSPIRPPQEIIAASKQPRMNPPLPVRPQVPAPATKLPSGITITPPKKTLEANKVANVLASRGITVTPSRQTNQSVRPQQPRTQPGSSSSSLNINSTVSITSSSPSRTSGGFAVPSPRRSAPIVNHNAERPERCMTVDLTQDDDVPHSQTRNRAAPGRFSCHLCGKVFASPPALAAHKIHHRNNLPYKCDLCSAEYNNIAHLVSHRQTCHKKAPAPDLAIPIVDLNHPGARDQLRKCGVHNFIPLAQLQSNSNGYFGVPIIQLDTAKEKAVSNLSLLGAGNILVLGKMKAINSQTGQ